MLLKVKPTAMKIYVANGKLKCSEVRKRTGCDICINGSFYNFTTLKPLCDVKVDGVVMSDDPYSYWGYGWDEGQARADMTNKMDKHDNYISAVALLKDGKKVSMSYNKDVGGVRGRSAIGYKADGTMVVYCFKDGTSGACTPEALASKMLSYGCVDALCLDGGQSVQIDCDEGVITSSRKVANYLCIWIEHKQAPLKCPHTEPVLSVRRGTRGNGAKWVQWYLNVLTDANLDVDGVFGGLSVDALKSFQRAVDLDDDGVCGRQTRAALKAAFEEK